MDKLYNYLKKIDEIKELQKEVDDYRNQIKSQVLFQFTKLYKSINQLPSGESVECIMPDDKQWQEFENGAGYIYFVIRFGNCWDNVAIPREAIQDDLSIDLSIGEMKLCSKYYMLNYGD